MKSHGNSYQNEEQHHLYEIRDKMTREAFKYGICGDPLRPDGTSERAEKQASLFSRIAGWTRFFAVILWAGIAGRAKARQKEDGYIEAFREKYGAYPPGNPDHKKYKG